MKPRLIISGGGTGGHIFPALAIADAFKAQYPQAAILFVGASNRMEMQRVPKAGYQIKGLWISGFDRKNMLRNILFPMKLVWSLLQSLAIVLRFRPL
jgi:UDP-N-acetylglucosamine--N-acetylmuramyl-(pentapeptide) pyrophosphoryl-undecaprenol N-acetylglucosamine transferase